MLCAGMDVGIVVAKAVIVKKQPEKELRVVSRTMLYRLEYDRGWEVDLGKYLHGECLFTGGLVISGWLQK